MTEQWRTIQGLEGRYEVSNHGRVRSLARTITSSNGRSYRWQGRVLKPFRVDEGHLAVDIDRKSSRIHILVLEAFVGPRPEGLEGCHKNGDPADNLLENLRWDTHQENALDAVRHGTHPMSRKTHCKWGHPFDEKNTRVHARGRSCRTCDRNRARNIRASKKGI